MPSAPSRFEVEHLHRLMIQASLEVAGLDGRLEQATATLSEAERHEGLLQENHRRVLELRKERERARDKYERLRQAYLAAQRDREAAQQQKVAEPQSQQQELKKAPLLDQAQLSKDQPGPVLVRLPRLQGLLERDRRFGDGVAARLEKTLSHLATAEHRTLTDRTAGELCAHLAQVDSVLARLGGTRGGDLADGVRTLSAILQRMNFIAARAGGAAHVAKFRKLIEERKGQLQRLAREAGRQGEPAQHYLATRGSSHLWNAVTTFNTLTRQGHAPRFSFGSWLKKNVSDHVSGALDSVSRTTSHAAQAVAGLASSARIGISSLGGRAAGALGGVASGGSLKDALKGGASGGLDAFGPGAFHAEKALSNPRARRTIGALERATSKGVKGGIWVSGKAARAQPVLDKAVAAGEMVHGALSQVHELAETGRRRHGPFGDVIEEIFGGADGRIHVDRGGARGEMDLPDVQNLDPAAMDTWIGSGEAVKLFSEVFGAFIPAEGAIIVHHAGGGAKGRRPGAQEPAGERRRREPRGGFFARLFDRLEGFAERVGGWAKEGSGLLGKGMHDAELGMHGLSLVEGAAERVHGFAGKAEGFFDKVGLYRLAGLAGSVSGAAGSVDEEAKAVHGGLKTADQWMATGKEAAAEVEHGAHVAAGVFDQAEHGRFGALVNLFKASKTGDGIDGKLSPDRVPLGSVFDEPRRLDVSTLSRMESFLGGDFSGVRIHTGPGAAEVTRRFNAEAVTVKDHVFFAPGRFNPASVEGQRLIAHELTHVLQKGRANLDVRTAEGEALHSEHSYGHGPAMETLNLRRPEPGFRIAADGDGMGASSGIHTAKRTRSRGHEAGGKDTLPDGEDLLEQISGRVYELLMEELEQSFESR